MIRFPYAAGDLASRGPAETVVASLPSGPGSGLVGDVNHDTRTIVFGPDGKMYVSVGSSCDLCVESEPRRAAVLQFNPDGSGGRIFASGLRNAVGLGVDPRTNLLWATVNERNTLGDEQPPDLLVPLRAGVNYGWPYCVGVPPAPDPQFGAGRGDYCRAQVETPLVQLPARSAPLGMRFSAGGAGDAGQTFLAPFGNGVFIALHGPFKSGPTYGHRVLFLSMVPGRMQRGYQDFVTGWNTSGEKWGAPVDVIFGADGALYISDDLTGAIYRVAYGGR